ncbi:hypothetical protein [Streptomyces sp. C]|uniref:hypothetical protein n=1 Tax=Streptomyces sp. C TaxID=253839 RepID=UPI0001DEF037|nr:hypothetical protein [Streptomyces sp. C]EFL15901.1 conserved hypothetical protein [Streptomyces sp. C]
MIASTPVARWSWGEPGRETDLVREAVRRFTTALAVLDRHHLGTPRGGRVAVEVPAMGRRSTLLRADFAIGPGADTATSVSFNGTLDERIKEAIADGEMGGVELHAVCDGLVETGGGGAEAVEGLFALSVAVSEGYFNVSLTTFSDAWMPFDLRGRAQDAVFQVNRPRLAMALAEIAEELDLEIDPDDPSRLGIPTESGVENHFEDDDGSPSDVWGRFEIPYRNEIFSQSPKFTAGYGRRASGAVRYVPVVGAHGVLGYLWASDDEGAASFEPRELADLDGYRAGLTWLDRLQEAYERGLAPTAAILELGERPADPVAGRVEVKATGEVDEFRKLVELAQE